jgi:hypothetical protein
MRTLLLAALLSACAGPVPACDTPDPLVRFGVRPSCPQGDEGATWVAICPIGDPFEGTDWVVLCGNPPTSLGPSVLCETPVATCEDGQSPRCERVPDECEGYYPRSE